MSRRSRKNFADLASAISGVADRFEEKRRTKLAEALPERQMRMQEERWKSYEEYKKALAEAIALKNQPDATPDYGNEAMDLVRGGVLTEELGPRYSALRRSGLEAKDTLARLLARTEPPPTTEDQRLAGALGISLESYLKRAGKLDKPILSENKPEKPSPTARFAALPQEKKVVAGARFGEARDVLNQGFLTPLIGLTSPESTAVMDEIDRLKTDSGDEEMPPGVKKIMDAGKAAGLISPGQQIKLTKDGLWTAQWLDATEGGYGATSKRVKATNNLTSAENIRKLFTIVSEE